VLEAVKTQYIGITRSLALAGVTNFSFVDEESKWKGSEVHRICELADRGTLDRKSVPKDIEGYMDAHRKFMRETGFICTHIEFKVQSKVLGVRGRIDRAGLMKGKKTILDFKTGSINPAVALQLALGGHLLDPSRWWHRVAIQLKADGTYSFGPKMPLMTWHADLATALSCVRVSRWKLDNRMV
jgi:hypothetical protein